jgi:hypothetical protein
MRRERPSMQVAGHKNAPVSKQNPYVCRYSRIKVYFCKMHLAKG